MDDHYLHRVELRDVTGSLIDVDRHRGVAAAVELDLTAQVVNQTGALQGGMTAALVDVACGCAIARCLEPGARYSTQDMNLHYLAPLRIGPARALARVRRVGGRSVVVQVDVTDPGADDRLCVVATAGFAVLEREG